MNQPAIPSCFSISQRATLSRLPSGSLCSALTGARHDAWNRFSEEGMAGFSRTKALLHFPLDIDRPSHGRRRQNAHKHPPDLLRSIAGPRASLKVLLHSIDLRHMTPSKTQTVEAKADRTYNANSPVENRHNRPGVLVADVVEQVAAQDQPGEDAGHDATRPSPPQTRPRSAHVCAP